MARGPYQGTFIPNVRQTVVTAPDGIVYINGEQEVLGCPQCTRTFDLNRYITSIQVDLNVDSAPGSASISLSIPRHTVDDFYFDGNPIITPMMEVEIYAKGYYLVEGLPQYYPIFWGLVTEVSDNYSGGEHTVSISCADILKWWELCKMNINPAFTQPAGQFGRNRQNNIFAATNPYDIIFTLALQSFGDVMLATGSFNQFVADTRQKESINAALGDIMNYWERRFSRIRNKLLLFGTSGVAVRGDTLYQKYSQYNPPGTVRKSVVASSVIRSGNGIAGGGQLQYDPADPGVAAYKFVAGQIGQIDLWQSSYQTKLEIANAAKEAVGFEFYMDVTGDLVFKPPFYNLDVIGNKPLSWVQDIDIIDWDFSDSESEVITQLAMEGSYSGNQDLGVSDQLTPRTSVTDWHLLRKYGWRQQSYTSEFMSNKVLMYRHGLDVLDRINSKRHRGNMTIPCRPELRLGFPIYVAPKDQIWYVSGISHSIQFGSRATTTMTLTAKRSKFTAPRGIGTLSLNTKPASTAASKGGKPTTFPYTSQDLQKSGAFLLDVSNTASLPPSADTFTTTSPGADNPYEPLILRHPKTGRVVGYPNVVMAYTRPFVPEDINLQAGQKTGTNPRVPKENQTKYQETRAQTNQDALERNIANSEDALVDRLLTHRYQYGLNSAGVYVYAYDSDKVISELLTLPKKNVNVTPSQGNDDLLSETAMIRPVSDDRGFELVGHYRYGRRVILRDGFLVIGKGDSSSNTKATVDLQLALTGDMFTALQASSHGLTTVTTNYADPAEALSRLQPEDLQTAGTINPQTDQPEFSEVDDAIAASTLGSQEEQGAPISIEATQLSRALTLAEMSVKDSSTAGDEDCVCITGRADLAFIHTGYQVKTLTGTSASDTSLLESDGTGGPITSGAIGGAEGNTEQLTQQLDLARARLRSLEDQARENPDSLPEQQAVLDQERVVRDLEGQREAAASIEDSLLRQYNTGESSPYVSKPGLDVVSKVDKFLTDLYQVLDEPHQQFEKAIRGDLLPQTPADTDFNAPETNPPSEFAPPFSAPNRFALGDPEATVGAITSNTEGIKQAWKSFGDDLRTNVNRKELSTQIAQDEASVSRLTRTRDIYQQQLDSGVATIGVNLPEEIDSINKRIEELRQNVADNKTKLSTA